MTSDHDIFRKKSTQIFDFLDLNKDGSLSLSEIRKGFEKLNLPVTTRDELLEELEFGQKKSVTKQEFEVYAEKQYIRVKELFDKLDTSKDSRISFDELTNSIKTFDKDFPLDKEVIQKVFNIVDTNHSGSIDFEEWCEFLILMPKLNIKAVVDYWQAVITVCDPNEFTLYGIQGRESRPPTANKSELKHWLANFGAGLFAGVFSRTITAPFERLKFINQVHYKGTDKPPGMLTGMKNLYQQDGFKGLFRGNLVTVIRSGPETSIKLAVFDQCKAMIAQNKSKGLNSFDLFWAGATAGVVSSAVTFPLVVIRTRLAAAPTGTYSGILDTITKMAKSEGMIAPFFKGLQPTILGVIPNSGLNLMTYDVLKRIMIGEGAHAQPATWKFMFIGGVSALLSSTLLYPTQIVTARLVMQGLMENQGQRKGMIGVTKDIFKLEGFSGFFKGYQAAIVKIIFGNAVSFGSYEFLKKSVNDYFKN